MESQFKVGAKVIALRSNRWSNRWGRTYVVHKIHANGNFLLHVQRGTEFHGKQWKPNWEGTVAYRTGDDKYRSPSMWLITPELEKRMEEECTAIANRSRGGELHMRLKAIDPMKLSANDEAVVELLKILEAE